MAKMTKGTQLFAIDPVTCAVFEVGCPTAIDGIDTTLENVETTCLSDSERTYQSGLGTPGTASVTIQFDPDNDASHERLYELKNELGSPTMWWAIGFPGDQGEPPLTTLPVAGSPCDFETAPLDRTFVYFQGYIQSMPLSFALNAAITSTIGIQVSGGIQLVKRA
jgi:hypothetical protein